MCATQTTSGSIPGYNQQERLCCAANSLTQFSASRNVPGQHFPKRGIHSKQKLIFPSCQKLLSSWIFDIAFLKIQFLSMRTYIHTPGIHINTKLSMWTYIYIYTRHTHKHKVRHVDIHIYIHQAYT